MKTAALSLALATVLLQACASAPPPPAETPQLLGRIEARQAASSTPAASQSKLALSPVAMAVQEVRHAGTHQVYTVKSAEGVRWAVASSADFAVGACVQAWGVARPLNAGYARLGELTLKASSDCK
ncbi:hypothetical protein [Aquabacterium sp.]|uniref:hypothetical protein n=1 Tax=Aquabacterium sp. TaxID=1872578 RepID=UPI00378384EA